jgi:hypothetical protein
MDDFLAKQEEANERHLDYFKDYEDEDLDYDLDKKITKRKKNQRKEKNYSNGSNYSNNSNRRFNNFNNKVKSRDESFSYNKKDRNNNGHKSDWRQPFNKDRSGMMFNKVRY